MDVHAAIRRLGPLLLAAALGLVHAAAVRAETPTTNISATLGTGLERGGALGGDAVTRLAPIMVDASVRQFTDDTTGLWLGGALRYELEGAGALGVVPRVELRWLITGFELRPGVGLPFYVAPRSLIGPEVSLAVRREVAPGVAMLGVAALTTFIGGSDLPERSTVVLTSLSVGAELAL